MRVNILAEDNHGRRAVLTFTGRASWLAFDPKDIAAMETFSPTRVFAVNYSDTLSLIEAILEQKKAAITVHGAE